MTIKLGSGRAKYYRRDGMVALMSITMGFAWTSQTILAVNCECPVSGSVVCQANDSSWPVAARPPDVPGSASSLRGNGRNTTISSDHGVLKTLRRTFQSPTLLVSA